MLIYYWKTIIYWLSIDLFTTIINPKRYNYFKSYILFSYNFQNPPILGCESVVFSRDATFIFIYFPKSPYFWAVRGLYFYVTQQLHRKIPTTHYSLRPGHKALLTFHLRTFHKMLTRPIYFIPFWQTNILFYYLLAPPYGPTTFTISHNHIISHIIKQ